MYKHYDAIISLGGHCKPAWHIRERFAITQAMPFDWWIISSESVAVLLEVGCHVLFDSKNLETIWDDTSVVDVKYNVIHHHDFPRDDKGKIVDNFAEHIAELKKKFSYLFERMDNTINASDRVLLVHAVPGHTKNSYNSSSDKILERSFLLHQAALKRWKSTNLDLLYLDGGKFQPSHFCTKEGDIIFDTAASEDENDRWASKSYQSMFDRHQFKTKPQADKPILSDMLNGKTWK